MSMKPVPPEGRFFSKFAVNEETGCWDWTASQDRHGYGRFRYNGRGIGAHRAGYLMMTGEIPEGLELDHLCRNPLCVNPGHLEPVTRAENTKRGDRYMYYKKTEACKRGHPWTSESTYSWRGERMCRICLKLRARERRALQPV